MSGIYWCVYSMDRQRGLQISQEGREVGLQNALLFSTYPLQIVKTEMHKTRSYAVTFEIMKLVKQSLSYLPP